MNHNVRNIFYLSLFFVSIKWFFIWFININFNFVSTVIENIEDWQYFTYIYNLANLNFSPTYDEQIQNNKYLAFPIYSILFHSISIKFFNLYGFILIEFLAIFTFFNLLIKIFEKLNFNFNQSIFLSLFIICLPHLIQFFNLSNIQYLNATKELYNLRIPRPLITHLYLFFLFYLLFNIKSFEEFNFKNLSLVGCLLALMWGSFYINFIISGLIFLIYYFLIFSKKKNPINKIFQHVVLVGIFFLIISSPLIYLIFINGEPDYTQRVGLISLNLEKKEILLKHFIYHLTNIKFLLVFTIITFCFLFLKKKKFYDHKNIALLYIIFISSFLAPIIFIIFSPKISEIYHFTNMIVALSFFVLTIFIFLIINLFIKNNIFYKYLINILGLLLVALYSISIFVETKNKSMNISLKHNSELISFFNKISFSNRNTILTFDGKVQSNLILDGYKEFVIVEGYKTVLNDNLLENKIIDSFHFLNLDKNDFTKFIENKKHGWRYINPNIGKTFYMKYQANKLTTFKNSMDFSKDEIEFISKSSPLHSQQLIIPKFEIDRLIKKFSSRKKNNQLDPKIIIINNDDFFSKNINIDQSLFCHEIINKTYEIFYSRNLNKACSN